MQAKLGFNHKTKSPAGPIASLRMADGGERRPLMMADGGMFDGLKRAIGMGPAETVTEKLARQDAARAKPAPPAPAPASPPPAGAISSYAANPVLDQRMKEAGLQDGGEVPGTGKGDKIPAKYEPGEFVVSNAMLDAQPELRDHLHALRTQVLAAQGRTPQEADAKAVQGGVMRKADGGDDERKRLAQIPTGGYPQAPAADGSQNSMLNTDTGRAITNTASALGGGVGGVAPAIASGLGRLATGGGAIARLAAGSPTLGAVAPYVPPVVSLGALGMAASGASQPTPQSTAAPAAASPVTAAPAAAPGPVASMATPNASTMAQRQTGNADVNNVTRVGNNYSGNNIGDGFTVNGKEPGGGFVNFSGGAPAGPIQALATDSAAPQGGPPVALSSANDWQKRNDLRNLEVSASSITNQGTRNRPSAAQTAYLTALGQDTQARYGADAGSINNATQYGNTQRLAMSEAGATKRTNIQQQGVTARNQIDQARLGLDANKANLDQRSQIQLLAAQDALTKAKTPDDRSAAEDNLRALQGKYERNFAPKFTVVPGGQTVDPTTGMAIREPSMVLDNATGQPMNISQPKAAPKIAEGSISTVGGKTAKYINGKWVPQ